MDGHEDAQCPSVGTLLFVLWYTTNAGVYDDHQCRVAYGACMHLVCPVIGEPGSALGHCC
jgi:hypothetical protein